MCKVTVNPATDSYLIGLTGNIATGKSTVAQMLVALGAELLDADLVTHEVLAPGGAAYTEVVAAFGPDILTPEGIIQRQELGRIVFSDPEALARLEAIIHPIVTAIIDQRIAASQTPVTVIEAIKLLESGMADKYDAIWVTICSEATQVARLTSTRGLSYIDALQRIHAQPPQADKIARADVVIDTDGTLADTRAQVVTAWQSLVEGK